MNLRLVRQYKCCSIRDLVSYFGKRGKIDRDGDYIPDETGIAYVALNAAKGKKRRGRKPKAKK